LFSKDFSSFSSVTDQNVVTDKKDGKSCGINDVTDVTDRERDPATNAPSDAFFPSAAPDLGPDPLDEDGAPAAERQPEPEPASGLGKARDRELAASYRRWEADEDLEPADRIDALRNTVREEHPTPHDEAAVEAEVQIILAMVRAGGQS
jgi:hypothetical protein